MDRNRPDALAAIEEYVLSSRRAASRACLEGMGSGPVLLTGAAGVGKTWLARLLAASTQFAWISLDVGPGMTAADLVRGALRGLGRRPESDEASPRFALAEALAERSADGRPVALVVDEAHGAGEDVLEEVRLQSNRLGRSEGFAAIVIVGQTPLARRLETRALEGLESRLAARIHLLPLDEREAREWLGRRPEGRGLSADQIEDLCRESGGIPARLDRLISRIGAASPPRSARERMVDEGIAAPISLATAGPILPPKPPLLVEEGMIEVGWDLDPELSADGDEDEFAADLDPEAEPEDEPIADHYAALQAWSEWVKNQGRASVSGDSPEPFAEDEADDSSRDEEREDSDLEMEAEDEIDCESSPLEDLPGVRVEGAHEFGPYGQLFARARPLKEAE